MLQRLSESQLFAKLSKCQLCQDSIKYLGHIVSAARVQPDPNKIQVMIDWPILKTLK